MKAISVRQPWAQFIVHYGKDIENRDWATKYRGPVLIHAAKGMAGWEYERAMMWVGLARAIPPQILVPGPRMMPRGGIIGIADLVDCVQDSASKWYAGPYGFQLANVRALPFIPCRGALGIFNVADNLLSGVAVGPRYCRACGCGEHSACPGSCYWVDWDLCSQCLAKGKLVVTPMAVPA